MELPKNEKPTLRGAVNPFRSFLKTDYLHLKTVYKDEGACLWIQLNWNKFLFYGDRLSGKMIHGINIAHSVSEKIT